MYSKCSDRNVVIIATTLLITITPAYSFSFNEEYQFEGHYATYTNEDKTEKYEKGPTYMTIIDEGTTCETMYIRDILE